MVESQELGWSWKEENLHYLRKSLQNTEWEQHNTDDSFRWPCHRSGYLTRQPRFQLRLSHVHRSALGQVSYEYFGFPAKHSFNRLLYNHHQGWHNRPMNGRSNKELCSTPTSLIKQGQSVREIKHEILLIRTTISSHSVARLHIFT
jgi:hypothetical protein